jgi:hypothetical protein
MEEAARAARQQTSIERQDRTYHGGAPSPGYHGVEPTLGGSNVPHGSDSADSASQSIGRGYGMVCLLGATALATAVEVGGILLPGPDDLLIAAAVGAKGGYRVIRGIVEGSKGTTREIAVVLSKEGKVLSRAEVEALRKCGAPKKVLGKGELFEQSVKDTFRKKIIKENEILRDRSGKVIGEIDFETSEATYEVGISLKGKTDQLHKLAEIAQQKGKRLDVVYGPDTSPSTLEFLKESLRKKWGNRVRFIPHE